MHHNRQLRGKNLKVLVYRVISKTKEGITLGEMLEQNANVFT